MGFSMTREAAELTPNEQWLRYANQGATRNQTLSPELVRAMSFLGDMGVQMEVFSGGQHGIETGSAQRVGSTRHDHGGAADVFFNQNGRRLDWANSNDRPIFEDIVRRARTNGITGIGAGEGYMRPGSMHIGFGDEAVWGAGGRGANAPDWLRTAFHSVGDGHGHTNHAEAQAANGSTTTSGAAPQSAFEAALARLSGGNQVQGGQPESPRELTLQDRLSGVGSALMSLDQGGPMTAPLQGQGGTIDLSEILNKVRTSPIFNRQKGLSL